MRKVIFGGSCLMVFVGLFTVLTASAGETKTEAQKPQVVGLLFYADWCGSCKELDPKIDKVKKGFDKQPILFTRFDLTDDFSRGQSQLFALLIGMDEVFKTHGGKTGFMLLIEAKSGKVLNRLVKTQTTDEIQAAIQATLK